MLGRTAGNGSAAGRRAVFAGAPGGVRAPPAGVRAPPAGREMGRPPGRGQRGVAQREEEGGCAGDGRWRAAFPTLRGCGSVRVASCL